MVRKVPNDQEKMQAQWAVVWTFLSDEWRAAIWRFADANRDMFPNLSPYVV